MHTEVLGAVMGLSFSGYVIDFYAQHSSSLVILKIQPEGLVMLPCGNVRFIVCI